MFSISLSVESIKSTSKQNLLLQVGYSLQLEEAQKAVRVQFGQAQTLNTVSELWLNLMVHPMLVFTMAQEEVHPQNNP